MKLHRFILKPLSPWTIPLRSDTLYGLLLWRIAERDGDQACKDAIDAFKAGSPPFVLSSVMPFDKICMPCLPPVSREKFRAWIETGAAGNLKGNQSEKLFTALQKYKKFRKEAYLSVNSWLKHASNLRALNFFASYCANFKEEVEKKQTRQFVEPHIGINRNSGTTEDGALFFLPLTFFDKGEQFHLYARSDKPEDLLELLNLAGELGFGKDANVGKGRFEVMRDKDFNPEPFENNGPCSMLLSVCSSPDMSAMQGWYAIEVKNGKTGPGMRNPFKNPMFMLKEGSLLTALPDKPFVLDGINPDTRITQITQPLVLSCTVAKGEF